MNMHIFQSPLTKFSVINQYRWKSIFRVDTTGTGELSCFLFTFFHVGANSRIKQSQD